MPAVSAPGKVLLAGGYLVLDRAYTGLVFGLSARIHVLVEQLETSAGVALEAIIVKSPQFLDATWEYGYRVTDNNRGIEITQLSSSAHSPLRPNPFIETTLTYVLTYVSTLISPKLKPAAITILADNEYYTQPSKGSVAEIDAGRTRFAEFGVALHEAHKTGLGSSAALVTALTAALLTHYLPESAFSLSSEIDKRKLHNLAQISHCAAQGKVGSGFDVASAVYGSCLYRRFSPSLLESNSNPGSTGFAQQLRALVDESDAEHRWDTEIHKAEVKMPPGIRLVMCDVDCGSQTPGMVKQVLAWREKEPDEADMLWTQLDRSNIAMAAELTRLAESGGEEDDHSRLTRCIADVRVLIREMSRLSGVPVEPDAQTRLLDACSAIEGVVGGVVPGAGGFDAVALLVEERDEVLTRLGSLIAGWKVAAGQLDAPPGSMGKVSVLRVREDMEGVRAEPDASAYGAWLLK